MIFSKQKMLNRIKAEGREDLVDNEVLAIMDNLDGQHASTACWNRQVRGLPLLWCVGKDGTGYEVREEDCE